MKVRETSCQTCIYKRDSHLDIDALEAAVKSPRGEWFTDYRACHHHDDGRCCRGFYVRHRHVTDALQIADRLDVVTFDDSEDLFETLLAKA